MTTIDTLRQRRRELMERKRKELERQAQGDGDNLALFMVEEELLEVNGQLRQLTAGRRIGNRVRSAETRSTEIDRKLYLQWMEAQGAEDDEVCQRGDLLRQVLRDADELLTDKQRVYLEDWSRGNPMERIAREHGVNKSTVSRVIRRAKARLNTAATVRETLQNTPCEVLSLSNAEVAALLMQTLTGKQAMYLYLYYGEWMSLREIAALLGLESHATVYHSICAGLQRMAARLNCGAVRVEDWAALDEVAYQIYQSMDAVDVLPPPERERLHKLGVLRPRQNRQYTRRADWPPITMEHRHGDKAPCKLLEALMAQKNSGLLGRWLAAIFGKMKRLLGRKK